MEKGGKETEMNDSWLEVRHQILHRNREVGKNGEWREEHPQLEVRTTDMRTELLEFQMQNIFLSESHELVK